MKRSMAGHSRFAVLCLQQVQICVPFVPNHLRQTAAIKHPEGKSLLVMALHCCFRKRLDETEDKRQRSA